MANFLTAEQAKVYSDHAKLDIELYKQRLASLIEENAKQGNTAVFTVLPKHLPLEDIRSLSAQLTALGYQVRFELLDLKLNSTDISPNSFSEMSSVYIF